MVYSFSLEDQGCSYFKILNLFQFTFSDRDYGEMEKLFYGERGYTPLLESEENFKLFLPDRDFVSGKNNFANLEHAMTKSRRMIILLKRYRAVKRKFM